MVNCLYAVSVAVDSNSPVIVGSVATFRAALCNLNHSLVNESFVYVWINNAVNHSSHLFDITTTRSLAGVTANMSKVFSLHVLPGHYVMEVRAYREPYAWLMAFKHVHPVAVGFQNFTLTGIHCYFVITLLCLCIYCCNWLCGCYEHILYLCFISFSILTEILTTRFAVHSFCLWADCTLKLTLTHDWRCLWQPVEEVLCEWTFWLFVRKNLVPHSRILPHKIVYSKSYISVSKFYNFIANIFRIQPDIVSSKTLLQTTPCPEKIGHSFFCIT